MHVRCPHCQHPIELVDESPLAALVCTSCGSSFSLVDDRTISHKSQAGKRLGHFELLEQLGVGAFGSVWKARDTKLDRFVAVKIPRPSQVEGSEGEAEKLLRDARAAAQLRHPNIVGVHEVGREDGVLYLVSDFIDGPTLGDWLTARRPSVREAAELVATIALALHHAHEAKVVHRDLKPSNIMLDAAGSPHIIDFGLAKREAGEITMTQDGQVLGTPAYMSPEQARGEGHHADRRSDIYSLGVILFELLTGERPFRGNTRMLIHQVLHDEAPGPRKLNSAVPKDLDTICLKCLEKHSARRYPTAKELADELRRYLANEPILARPIGRLSRAARWCRRKPALAATIALGVLLAVSLAAGTPALIAALLEARRQQGLAVEAESLAKRQAEVATVRRLAAESRAVRQEFPIRAMLLASEAVARSRDMEEAAAVTAENELRESLSIVGGLPLAASNGLVAFSSDGRWLALGDGTSVKLCDMTATDPRVSPLSLVGNQRPVVALAFSADARWLATASEDATCRVWDLHVRDPNTSARTLAPLEKIGKPDSTGQITTGAEKIGIPHCLAFSSDARWLVVAGDNDSVGIWDLTASDPHESFRTLIVTLPTGRQNTFSMSSDGRWLATLGTIDGLKLWDLALGDDIPHFDNDNFNFSNGEELLATSPDGRWLASAQNDQVVFWDLTDDIVPASVRAIGPKRSGVVNSLAFSPENKWLACGTTDGAVSLIGLTPPVDTVSRELVPRHNAFICSIAFSPDGRWLVTGDGDKTVRIWDLTADARETVPRVLRGHEERVDRLAISPDGHWLVTASSDGAARVWDLAATSFSAEPRILPAETSSRTESAISADGSLIAIATQDTAEVWNLASNKASRTRKFTNPGQYLRITSDRRWLLAPTEGNGHSSFGYWDMQNGGILGRISLPKGASVHEAKTSPDGRWLAVDGEDYSVSIWDMATRNPSAHHRILRGPAAELNKLKFSGDSRWLAATVIDQSAVYVWDLLALDPNATLRTFPGEVNCGFAFCDYRRWIAVDNRSSIQLWDLTSTDPTPIRVLRTIDGRVEKLSFFTPDGQWLVGTMLHGDERIPKWGLWSLAESDAAVAFRDLGVNENYSSDPHISPDGRWLVYTGDRKDLARLWDVKANFREFLLEGYDSRIYGLKFSPESRWLATDNTDKSIRLWDLASANPAEHVHVLRGHEGIFPTLTFSTDGRWLATNSTDSTQSRSIIRLWNLAAKNPGTQSRVFTAERGSLHGFSRDGRWLQATTDGGVLLWDLSVERMVDRAADLAGRQLSEAELQQYQISPHARPSSASRNSPVVHYLPAWPTNADWHERMAAAARAAEQTFGAMFHERRAAQLREKERTPE